MNAYFRSTKLFLFSTLLATTLQCGGSGGTTGDMANLQGRISEGGGSQSQSLKILSGSFGGAGSVTAAVKVRVGKLKVDGSLEVVAEAAVQSGGRYSIAVPPGQKRLIIQCLDASGSVLASAIVEASGGVGETVTVTPMDTESSVEAAVLARMAANGVAIDEIDPIDLRSHISVGVAAAVKAAADVDVKVKALAEAVTAAQSAKVKAYASVGINTSVSALFDAELAAAKKLNAALDASASASLSADQAYASFYGDLSAGLLALDTSAKKHARAASIASVAFRSVVKARLSASGDAVAEAALRAAASGEARISAAMVDTLLVAGSASADVTTAAKAAAATLSTQLSASVNAAASAAAFVSWNAALSGSTSVSGSVLGNYLGVNVATAAVVQGSVTAIAAARVTLDAALKLTANTLTATGTIDYNVLAQSIITAYTAFQATVDLQAAAVAGFGTKAQVALDVMATANGAFRLQ